ncbi:hypothetical protein GcM3_151010 [Golovinomyces cichoracearum]|uniref:Uncharacterized protein n=1 Tax=Golovinomyces cichoracearum TaxID=62708 RepID=A0A420HX08_9PEZI|nr:hypothetical protein GcM3_151010 [Golovinomyces cichoracearum]
MDSSSFQNDEDNHYRSNLKKSQSWELEYQASLWSTEKIVHEEEIRRLKLSTLVLRNQKDDFDERILSRDDRIATLEQECEDLRLKLAHSEQKNLQQETYFQSQESIDTNELEDIILAEKSAIELQTYAFENELMNEKISPDASSSKLPYLFVSRLIPKVI